MAAQVRELKALRLLIEQTREGVLAFSLFSDVGTREGTADWLRNQSSVPVEIVRLSRTVVDLVELIRPFPPIPRRCLLFFDIEAAFPAILGYVNFHREVLLQCGHALVFWIREEGMRRIAEGAPDFWAWRSHVFDFRIAQDLQLESSGPHDAVIGHYDIGQLTMQVEALEESSSFDLVSQLALGRRQLALGRFEDSSKALEQAVAQAERQGDKRGLVEALLLLGNSKLEQGLLDEAEVRYRRSIEIGEQIGSKEGTLNAARQLSVLAQRKGDAESAYKFAKMMMRIAETTGDLTALASAHDQLGNVLFARNDLRAAEQEYLTAAKLEQQLNHRSDLAFTLAQLGRVYMEMGAVSQAEIALRRAAVLFRESGLESAEAQVDVILRRMEAD